MRMRTPDGQKNRPSGNWVMPNEMGNELGNESACGKRLIFATGLRQVCDTTCDKLTTRLATPLFGKVGGKMRLSGFPAYRGTYALL